MFRYISFIVLIFAYSCQNNVKENFDDELILKELVKNDSIINTSKKNDSSDTIKVLKETISCFSYKEHSINSKVIYDTLKTNPIEKNKIINNLDFQLKTIYCANYYSKTLVINKNMKIEFIENNDNPNYNSLILINDELFTIKKLLGEMFVKNSEIYFHYDTGEMYEFENGDLLYVDQPGRWCGKANQFDFYQYFDLKNREIIQFVEKDNFINTLK